MKAQQEDHGKDAEGDKDVWSAVASWKHTCEGGIMSFSTECVQSASLSVSVSEWKSFIAEHWDALLASAQVGLCVAVTGNELINATEQLNWALLKALGTMAAAGTELTFRASERAMEAIRKQDDQSELRFKFEFIKAYRDILVENDLMPALC
ncbi:hypothetical protein FVE85_8572 [Porphyridium purpureum]|uniref:Uncharacterized protein n=1 Tax=Porphyridium purpureum TaxID=35688 RepID=A0A5J4YRT0_PORPP|nr:hypothetical protein FVE85_8572 [Porphyridium purpureum]|eukprot:POR2550..scf296_7